MENLTGQSAPNTPDSTLKLPDSTADITQKSPDSTVQLADSTPDNTQKSPDSTADSTVQLPDSTQDFVQNLTSYPADSTQKLPDSRQDFDICPADNTPDDRQNSDFFSKISILELQKKYNIGRDSLYGRMRYLQITTWKIGKKAYLDGRQITHMDGLHDHIQATGKMEGYPIPFPSGPVEEQPTQQTAIQPELSAQPTAIQHEQPTEPTGTQPEQPTAAITVSQVSAQEQTVVVAGNQQQQLNSVEARQHDHSEVEAIASLVRNAQSKATGLLIAENMLAQQFIQNPEQLPEELRAKIQQSAAVPEIDPFAYANALVNFANKSAAA